MTKDRLLLRRKLAAGEFVLAPGAQDMIAAVLAERAGFDVIYGSGYWLTASAHGLPDAGIATYTDMRDRIATLARTTNAAVIADADTGYGGLLNVHHTVRGYEAAGAQAIQIEDQEFPKQCGHSGTKRVVPMEEMAQKIKVAREARSGEDGILIIARSDARHSEGLDGLLRRLEAYAKAGADILLPEALVCEEEMRIARERFDLPLMLNMANGGLTPILSRAVMQQLGYNIAIFPSLPALAAAKAMETALAALRDEGVGDGGETALFDFKQFGDLIGFKEVRELEARWGL